MTRTRSRRREGAILGSSSSGSWPWSRWPPACWCSAPSTVPWRPSPAAGSAGRRSGPRPGRPALGSTTPGPTSTSTRRWRRRWADTGTGARSSAATATAGRRSASSPPGRASPSGSAAASTRSSSSWCWAPSSELSGGSSTGTTTITTTTDYQCQAPATYFTFVCNIYMTKFFPCGILGTECTDDASGDVCNNFVHSEM
ncbi:uncharacterized protein LOC100273378 [Zea mays]|uniref:Uncharacterized protein n=1 Tax=Zea mays TaxID=4577 RepID=B4FV42_MAIZE|nr:uncharacterized protein LOC100273378 [Zea mays]ACF85985.1 unknown [Zea mays]|eukprot:NP_001141288.1 uncharacterized protein LOC100273378 [Zea mays]